MYTKLPEAAQLLEKLGLESEEREEEEDLGMVAEIRGRDELELRLGI